MSRPRQARPIILFDSQCVICCKIKQLIGLVDFKKEINFVSIHDHEIYEQIETINFWDCRNTVHLIDENDQVYQGEAVIEYLLDRSNLANRFAPLYKSSLGKMLLKRLYDELNEYRKLKMKDCEACQS